MDFPERNPEFEEPFEECMYCGEADCPGSCQEQQEDSDPPWMHDSSYDQ